MPITAILLLIALFTTISEKPLDGFLLLTVAILLTWDSARSRLRGPASSGSGPAVLAAVPRMSWRRRIRGGPGGHSNGPGATATGRTAAHRPWRIARHRIALHRITRRRITPGRIARHRIAPGRIARHRVTVIGHLIVLAGATTRQTRAAARPHRMPSLGSAGAHMMQTRTGHVGVLVPPARLRLHFLARYPPRH